jgi:hypothetical protein
LWRWKDDFAVRFFEGTAFDGRALHAAGVGCLPLQGILQDAPDSSGSIPLELQSLILPLYDGWVGTVCEMVGAVIPGLRRAWGIATLGPIRNR